MGTFSGKERVAVVMAATYIIGCIRPMSSAIIPHRQLRNWATPGALQASLDEVIEQADNFRSYTAEGNHHCMLETTKFYNEENNGIRIRDWVADLANQINVENVQ